MKKSKILSTEQKEELLNLKPSDVTLSFIKKFFTNKGSADFTSQLSVPRGVYDDNKSIINTTAGRYLLNLFLFEKFRSLVPYVNKAFSKKVTNEILSLLTEELLEGNVSEGDYVDFINKLNWIGFSTASFTTPPLNLESIECPPKTAKLRKELFKKYQDELKNSDLKVTSMIEGQLLDSAKKELEATDSPIMDFYNSGSRGSFTNNYKNVVLMRGLVADPSRPGSYTTSLSNLSDGTLAEDQVSGGNLLLTGSAGRALDTRSSGLALLK